MNTQEKYLRRQLEQVNEELEILVQKSRRLEHRYNQLLAEKEALQEDLKGLTTQPRKKEDLKIYQIRTMDLNKSKTE